MIVRRVYGAKTITLAVTVAAVEGCQPLIGFSEEVEKAWRALQQKFGLKDRKKKRVIERSESTTDICRLTRAEERRRSEVNATMSKFRQMDTAAQEAAYTDDVYSPFWKPPKFDKRDPNYGRPKAGSLTEKRGIAAGHHIGKEIIQLCEVISENGQVNGDGTVRVTFGKLFNVYVYISDKVVGMLLRARKHGLLAFEGEMLYQRRDEAVTITLLKPLDEVRRLYSQSDDPASCLLSEP